MAWQGPEGQERPTDGGSMVLPSPDGFANRLDHSSATTGLVRAPTFSISTVTGVARLQEARRGARCAYPVRGAGHDHRPRLQGAAAAEEGDQLAHVEDHVAGAPVLQGLAVHHRLDAQGVGIRNLVRGDQRRSQRTEGVEGLAAAPLPAAPLHLPIAGAHVVAAGVAEHVVDGLLAADVAAAAADHHRQLALVVHLVAAQRARQHDGTAGALHRRRHLHEQHRIIGRRDAGLRGVAEVVEADAQHAARHYRGQQLRSTDHPAGHRVGRAAGHAGQRIAVDGDDGSILSLTAVADRLTLGVAYDSHGARIL